jgi:hypothetical protein
MQTDEYTEGHTAPIEYDLRHDNASYDATGMTPSLVLKDKDGAEITITGTVEWATAATSRIRFNPAATDLVASKSPYTLRWKVTDLSGKIAYYPQGQAITLKIFSK